MNFRTIVIIGALLSPAPAFGQNLNQKYGDGWNCKRISAELNALYEACLRCERSNKDFYRTSNTTGDCVPKYSLRQLETEDDDDDPDAGRKAYEREMRSLQQARPRR